MTTRTAPASVPRGPLWTTINAPVGALIVVDGARRLYVALNRAGNAYHLIQPARAWDPRVVDGKVAEGSLVCTCEGGTFHGRCYQTVAAEALERELDADPPAWMGMAARG